MSTVTEPLKSLRQADDLHPRGRHRGSDNHFAVRSMFSGFPVASYDTADPNVKSADQLIADHLAARAAHAAQVAAPGGHPGRLDQLLPALRALDLLLRAQAGRLRGQPGDRFRPRVRRAGRPPRRRRRPWAATSPATLDLLEAEIGELGGKLKDSSRRAEQADPAQGGAAVAAARRPCRRSRRRACRPLAGRAAGLGREAAPDAAGQRQGRLQTRVLLRHLRRPGGHPGARAGHRADPGGAPCRRAAPTATPSCRSTAATRTTTPRTATRPSSRSASAGT